MSRFYKDDKAVLLDVFEKNPVSGLNLLEANVTDAAGEKHVPVIEKDGQDIIVRVGEVPHPMMEEHYNMGVYIETKQGGQLCRFQPGDEPRAVFTLAPGDELVAAYEYCNLHGLWKADA